MDSYSMGAGFMAIFAVAGSVVLLTHHVHKHLLSEFMKKIEFELGSHKDHFKKTVRFSEDVKEPSSDNKGYRRKHLSKSAADVDCNSIPSLTAERELNSMPLNRRVLYKGIIEYRTLKRQPISS